VGDRAKGKIKPTEELARLKRRVARLEADLAERGEVEERLRQRGDRLAQLLANFPGVAFLKDDQGRYVYANRAYETESDPTPEARIGRSDDDIFPPQLAGQYKRHDRLVLETGQATKVVEENLQPDGVHYQIVHKFPVSGLGSPRLIGGLCIDITELKRLEEELRIARDELDARVQERTAEMELAISQLKQEIAQRQRAEGALRESELRYRMLVEKLDQGLVRTDEHNIFNYVNVRFCQMLGRRPEELLGRPADQFLDQANREIMLDQRARRAAGEQGSYELVWSGAEGEEVFSLVSPTGLFDETGRFSGSFAVITDISQLRRAEETLRESEEKYRTIFEMSRDAIYITTPQGQALDFNQATLDLFGYSGEEFRNLDVKQVYIDPRQRAWAATQLEKEGFIKDHEILLRRKDGSEVFCLDTAVAWRSGDGAVRAYIGTLRDISERKRAEEEVLRQKAYLEHLIEKAPEAIVLADKDDVITRVNQEFTRLFGFTAEDAVGRRIDELIAPDSRRDEAVGITEQVALTDRVSAETTRQRKDGSLVEVSLTASSIRFRGERVGVFAIYRDITARRLAEEALRASEARFREMSDLLPTPVAESELSGRLTYLNRAGFEALGCAPADLEAGLSIWEIVSPADAGRMKRRLKAMALGENPGTTEYTLIRRDGSEVNALINSAPILEHGRAVGFRSTVQDITRLKASEAELREREERFRQLAELLPETIFETDLEGRLTLANRAAYQTFGYSREDFTRGISALDMLAPEDRDRAQQNIGERLSGKISKASEYTALTKDGRRFPVILHASPIVRQGEAAGLRGLIVDITERKRTEDQLKAALREKEVLLREVHHRVKNNMQVISSLLNLQAGRITDPKLRGPFQESQGRVRAMSLIHETLFRSDSLGVIDFREYVSSLARDLFQAYATSSGRIALKIEAEKIELGLDQAVPLGLVINELMANSLKYAFPGGRRGEIRVQARSLDQDEVELAVSDNGVGLPQDFNWRGAKTLGLSIVAGLVETQLGGTVSLDRQRGARFSIRFKRAQRG